MSTILDHIFDGSRGGVIELATSQQVTAAGSTKPVSDFSVAGALLARLTLNRVVGSPTINVVLEHSDDADSWSQLAAFNEATGERVQTLQADAPKAYVRVSWTISGGSCEIDVAAVAQGKSSGLRMLDPGLVTVADLIANGPKTLYTPPRFQWVAVDWAPQDTVGIDNGGAIVVGNAITLSYQDFTAAGLSAQSNNWVNQITQNPDQNPQSMYGVAPIIAALSVASTPITSMGVWAAHTPFVSGVYIKADDPVNGGTFIWQAGNDGGTTGGSLPVFNADASPVDDADFPWNMVGELPTVGAAHPILWVATIEAL